MKPRDIKIRLVEASDRRLYTSWLEDPALQNWHFNIADSETEFQRVMRSRYNFLIVFEGIAVGHIAIQGDWGRSSCAEIGIMVIPSYHRRGIARVAAAEAIQIAFSREDIEEIWAGVLVDNEVATHFCRAVGFHADGSIDEVPEANIRFVLSRRHWETSDTV
jgi:RimJ/RimL family protein N-acetyltransferase